MDGPGGMGMGMGYDRMAGYERLGYPGTGNTPSPTLRRPPLLLGPVAPSPGLAAHRI